MFQRDLDLLLTLPTSVLDRLIDPEAPPALPPASVSTQLAKLSSSGGEASIEDAVALSEAYIKEMREKGAELARDEEGSNRSLEFRSRVERIRTVAEQVQGSVEEYAQTAGVQQQQS